MVFEADDNAAARGFAAFEFIVADHARFAADGIQIERADKVAALAVIGLVIAAEHLVAAADGQEGHAVCDGGSYFLRLAAVQIVQQHLLLEVLPAADEHEVEAREARRRADRQARDRAVYPAALKAASHAYDVAAVAVEIQHVGVHVAYFKFHDSSPHSQNSAPPQCFISTSRSSSIAV